jgi:hypothetical protein
MEFDQIPLPMNMRGTNRHHTTLPQKGICWLPDFLGPAAWQSRISPGRLPNPRLWKILPTAKHFVTHQHKSSECPRCPVADLVPSSLMTRKKKSRGLARPPRWDETTPSARVAAVTSRTPRPQPLRVDLEMDSRRSRGPTRTSKWPPTGLRHPSQSTSLVQSYGSGSRTLSLTHRPSSFQAPISTWLLARTGLGKVHLSVPYA